MIFFVAITGLCIWRCTKRGAQVPDMFLGALFALALTAFVDLTALGGAIDGGFASAWNGIQKHI